MKRNNKRKKSCQGKKFKARKAAKQNRTEEKRRKVQNTIRRKEKALWKRQERGQQKLKPLLKGQPKTKSQGGNFALENSVSSRPIPTPFVSRSTAVFSHVVGSQEKHDLDCLVN
jgi:hypothetical protein